jgi:hypothetical protein
MASAATGGIQSYGDRLASIDQLLTQPAAVAARRPRVQLCGSGALRPACEGARPNCIGFQLEPGERPVVQQRPHRDRPGQNPSPAARRSGSSSQAAAMPPIFPIGSKKSARASLRFSTESAAMSPRQLARRLVIGPFHSEEDARLFGDASTRCGSDRPGGSASRDRWSGSFRPNRPTVDDGARQPCRATQLCRSAGFIAKATRPSRPSRHLPARPRPDHPFGRLQAPSPQDAGVRRPRRRPLPGPPHPQPRGRADRPNNRPGARAQRGSDRDLVPGARPRPPAVRPCRRGRARSRDGGFGRLRSQRAHCPDRHRLETPTPASTGST